MTEQGTMCNNTIPFQNSYSLQQIRTDITSTPAGPIIISHRWTQIICLHYYQSCNLKFLWLCYVSTYCSLQQDSMTFPQKTLFKETRMKRNNIHHDFVVSMNRKPSFASFKDTAVKFPEDWCQFFHFCCKNGTTKPYFANRLFIIG